MKYLSTCNQQYNYRSLSFHLTLSHRDVLRLTSMWILVLKVKAVWNNSGERKLYSLNPKGKMSYSRCFGRGTVLKGKKVQRKPEKSWPLFLTAVGSVDQIKQDQQAVFWVSPENSQECVSLYVCHTSPGPWLLSVWWIAEAKALGARTAGSRKGWHSWENPGSSRAMLLEDFGSQG